MLDVYFQIEQNEITLYKFHGALSILRDDIDATYIEETIEYYQKLVYEDWSLLSRQWRPYIYSFSFGSDRNVAQSRFTESLLMSFLAIIAAPAPIIIIYASFGISSPNHKCIIHKQKQHSRRLPLTWHTYRDARRIFTRGRARCTFHTKISTYSF